MPETMTVFEAAAYTGLSKNTITRRADAWEKGDRSAYAIRSGRTSSSDRAHRRIDRVDAERVRLQTLGELPLSVTAEEYAASLGEQGPAAEG